MKVAARTRLSASRARRRTCARSVWRWRRHGRRRQRAAIRHYLAYYGSWCAQSMAAICGRSISTARRPNCSPSDEIAGAVTEAGRRTASEHARDPAKGGTGPRRLHAIRAGCQIDLNSFDSGPAGTDLPQRRWRVIRLRRCDAGTGQRLVRHDQDRPDQEVEHRARRAMLTRREDRCR